MTTVFISSQIADACSFLPGTVFPTVEETVSGGGIVTLARSLSDGSVVAAEKIISTSPESPRYFVLELPGHSCASRYDDFETGEYIVSVTPEIVTILSHSSLDSEFSFSFDSLDKAQEKYTTLNTSKNVIHPVTVGYEPVGYTLRFGMNNNDVKELQKSLNTVLGIDLVVDGDYGRGTRSAVNEFQNQYNLFADGIAGSQTQNQLSEKTVSRPVTESNGLDEFGRIVSPQCKIASFCNGPIECVNADLDTSGMAGTCEYRERYACYKNAGNICETQSTGNCGWTQTDALQMCIAEADLIQETE